MSTLLSALVSRQLLLRCGTSKWSPILCHNQNYTLSTQRFSSEFKYNNEGRRKGSNYVEPEQQQQQSTFERHNINTRNNRRRSSDHLGDQRGSSSIKVSGQLITFKSVPEILNHLEVSDDRLIDSYALKDLIQMFRRCLLNQKQRLTNEEILDSVGMKKLLYLITERQLSVSTLLDVFGIFVKLGVPGDHRTFHEICSNLANHVTKLPLDRINFLSHQIRRLSPESRTAPCVQQLQQAMGQYLPVESTRELLQFMSISVDENEFSAAALDDVIENLRRLLTTDGPTSIQEEDEILNCGGMKKLCRLIEMESPDVNVNLLINALGIFQILNTPASHPTFKLVLHLIRQRLDENSVSRKQVKFLIFVLDKLLPESTSAESAEILEVLENFNPYKNSSEFLDYLMLQPEERLEDEALHEAIKTLRQLLINETETLTPIQSAKILSSAGMMKLRRSIEAESVLKREHININSVLNFFGIFEILTTPASNLTFQNLMILLQKNLEQDLLSMDQVRFLSFQLDKLRPISQSQRSETLKSSLMTILNKKYSQENETESGDNEQQVDFTELGNQLEMAVKAGSAVWVRNVLSAISAQRNNLRYRDCFRILWCIADFEHPEFMLKGYTPLLDLVIQILTQNVGVMSKEEILVVLSKCGKNYKFEKNVFFYDANFLQALLARLVQIGDEDSLLTAVPDVKMMQHRDTQFMDAVADIVIKRASLGEQLNDETAIDVEDMLSKCNYKPKQWAILKDILLDHPAMMKDLNHRSVSHVLGFLVLDTLPIKLLHKIFSPDYETDLKDWVRADGHGPIPILMIYNAVKYLYPNYEGPLPSLTTVREWERVARIIRRKRSNQVLPYLEEAFGGEGSVLSDFVYEGVVIDHCVALGPDGSPWYLGDLTSGHSLPVINDEDGKLILLIIHRNRTYLNNERVLGGIHRLEMEIMKKLGLPFVEVDLQNFLKLSKSDRISWLKDQVLEQHRKER